MTTINGVTFNLKSLRIVSTHRNTITEQPGSDTDYISDMGYGGLILRLQGWENTIAEYDAVIAEFMKTGAQEMVFRTGWQYSVYSAQLSPVLLEGIPENYFPYDLMLKTSTPYRESIAVSCRAKDITANNQEWSAEDMPCNNLLSNWSFENWSGGAAAAPDGWVLPFTGNTAARQADPIFGTYCAEFINDGTGGDDRLCRYYSIPLIIGTEYTFGIWIKSISGYTTLPLHFADASKGNNTITTSWVFYTWTWTADATVISYLDLGDPGGGAATIRIDGAVLIEGSSIPDNTFTRDITTSGSVDAVPDIQITSDSTVNEYVTQLEKL